MIGFVTSCKGAAELALFIKPSGAPFTSESVSIQVVFTNTSDATISFPTPVLGRNLTLCTFDNNDTLLTRSGILVKYDDEIPVVKPIALMSRGTWTTESLNLFEQTSPSFMITPNQTIRVLATYTLTGKEYNGSISLVIPEHDMQIKQEYISSKQALDLARQAIEEKGYGGEVKDITPTMECINGIYRIIYSRPLPPRVRGSTTVVGVHVDAISGVVLRIFMGS